MAMLAKASRKIKRVVRNGLKSDRDKLREKMQPEVEARFNLFAVDQPESSGELFEGVVASQSQQPPVVSLLIEAPERFFHSEALLPFALLSSLVLQRSERWELLVYSERLSSQHLQRLTLWVELLRRHTASPIRIVRAVRELNAWGSLLAWSSGTYLMAVTPNSWLDQDLVTSIESQLTAQDPSSSMISLEASLCFLSERPGYDTDDQHFPDHRPFLLKRRWVLQQHALQEVGDLHDPEHWSPLLSQAGTSHAHGSRWIASATDQVIQQRRRCVHWLLIPVYGLPNAVCMQRWLDWKLHGFNLILIDNNPSHVLELPEPLKSSILIVRNHNLHRLAGGINRGMATPEARRAEAITILDQDSSIKFESLDHLRVNLLDSQNTIWGPMVYDLDRRILHAAPGLRADWFLMTSGTTLRHQDWTRVGPYNKRMEIDYLDHEWSARAAALGYQLKCSDDAILLQAFGEEHPNPYCRRLGMHLYSPVRHEASLRNLLWLLRDPRLPGSFKLKESAKMLLKPVFWLLFEPQRSENAKAILAGLLHGFGCISGKTRSPIATD